MDARPPPVFGNLKFFITPMQRIGATSKFERQIRGHGRWEVKGRQLVVRGENNQ
ncbi:hypothetical protein Tco_1321615, partial [Tanacetum coccineum]